MTKKILLIIGILAVVGLAVFFIFFSKPAAGPGENRVGFSIRDYLPFGRSPDTGSTSTTTAQINTGENSTTTATGIATNQPIPRLRKISSEPVAGAAIFNIGTTSFVRFVEKGTGNVYEARSDSLSIQRLTNTTIPKIIRAYWLPNGSGFLAQTLDTDSQIIQTSFVKLNKNVASSTSEILTPFNTSISKLPTDIKELTIKPDGSKIFYYTINGAYSNWYVANPDGTGATLVNTSPLTEWLPKWISGNTVVMQTKASSEVVGLAYTFDVSNRSLRKIETQAPGLYINPNSDGSLDIVSNGGSFPQLYVFDSQKIASTQIKTNTLAEKCLWLSKEKTPTVYCAVPNMVPAGNYPDVWYKGLVSTQDFIQKMEVNNDVFYNIADLTNISGEKIDVVGFNISPDQSHLIFRNKIDGYLWMLRIAE